MYIFGSELLPELIGDQIKLFGLNLPLKELQDSSVEDHDTAIFGDEKHFVLFYVLAEDNILVHFEGE